MRQKTAAARVESRLRTEKLIEEDRRYFEGVYERLASKLDAIAKGVAECHASLDRLDAHVARFAADVAQDFHDTRTMMMQSRVERLESTTH
jgi:hypothetical protein